MGDECPEDDTDECVHNCVAVGLIPLVSVDVHNMKTVYEAGEDDEVQDVVFHLDVHCDTDDTLSVTSNDLILDPAFPRACVWLEALLFLVLEIAYYFAHKLVLQFNSCDENDH